MHKKTVLLTVCIILGVLLLVLYLLSSTDIILKENQDKVYKVTVLISDTTDTAWQSFKQGADHASTKYNVDLQYKTLYNWRKVADQQNQAMTSEIMNGTQSLVLFAADPVLANEQIQKTNTAGNIISAGVSLQNEKIFASILYDYKAMGEALANQIIKDEPEEYYEVAVVSDNSNIASNQLFIDGLKQALGDRLQVKNLIVANTEQATEVITQFTNVNKNVSLIALTPQTAVYLAKAAQELDRASDIKIYSYGHTNEILTYLETGFVQAIVCANQYDAGYLCVEKAVNSIEKRNSEQQITLEYRVITKSNMFDSENERFIFSQ